MRRSSISGDYLSRNRLKVLERLLRDLCVVKMVRNRMRRAVCSFEQPIHLQHKLPCHLKMAFHLP
jgi:hypothetical protein